MNMRNSEWDRKVMTVEGLIPGMELGVTLPHEHLIVQGWDHRERNYLNSACMELVKFSAAGGKTIVDVSSTGLPRDPEFVRRLAARSKVQVVLGTGFYREAWLPPEVCGMTVQEIAAHMVREISEGIDGTSIRAGVIGELGVSREMTRFEERVLAAAARAQTETGTGISVHFEIGSTPAEYHHALDVLQGAGADLQRVAVDHLVSRPDNLELCLELAGRGCFLEFDLFGQQHRQFMDDLMHTHSEVQVSSIRGFVENGLLPHMLVSQNVQHVELMTVNGGDGYAHLLKNVVPGLKSYGVTDDQLLTLMVDNPARWLAFACQEEPMT